MESVKLPLARVQVIILSLSFSLSPVPARRLRLSKSPDGEHSVEGGRGREVAGAVKDAAVDGGGKGRKG